MLVRVAWFFGSEPVQITLTRAPTPPPPQGGAVSATGRLPYPEVHVVLSCTLVDVPKGTEDTKRAEQRCGARYLAGLYYSDWRDKARNPTQVPIILQPMHEDGSLVPGCRHANTPTHHKGCVPSRLRRRASRRRRSGRARPRPLPPRRPPRPKRLGLDLQGAQISHVHVRGWPWTQKP